MDRPEWLVEMQGVRLTGHDPEARTVNLQVVGPNSSLAFGHVPADYRVAVSASGHGLRLVVTLLRQEAGVEWDFRLGPGVQLSLPAAMTQITATRQQWRFPVPRISWARKSGRLTLGGGEFWLAVGESRDGHYSVSHVDVESAAPLVLAGPAMCERLDGPGRLPATIGNPAPGLVIADHSAKVTVTGVCRGVTSASAKSLEFKSAVGGEVDLVAEEITFTSISAAGAIDAHRVGVSERMTGTLEKRLACAATEWLWCSQGTDRVDITLEKRGLVVPYALLGANAFDQRLREHVEHAEPHSLEPAEVKLASPVPANAAVTDTTFVGPESEVDLACSAAGVTLVGVKTVRAASSISVRAPGNAADDRTALVAADVFVGGYLDLGESAAAVSGRLHATRIRGGSISAGDGVIALAVATREVRSCRPVHARLLRVASRDDELGIVDSEVHAGEHCHVSGSVDESSALYLMGDASFQGPVSCAKAIEWTPSPWNREIDRQTLALDADVRAVKVKAPGGRSADAVVDIGPGASVASLSTSRDVGFEGPGSGFVEDLEIASGVRVWFGKELRRFPSVRVGHDVTITLGDPVGDDGLARPTCTLGLAKLEPDASATLDSVEGTISVVPAPALPDGTRPDAPDLRLLDGSYVLGAVAGKISCTGTVWLDVSAEGRVNELVGKFSTRSIQGRVEGSQAKGRRAVLVAWPHEYRGRATDDELREPAMHVGQQGQLIEVDISALPASNLPSLKGLEVLSPSSRPLIDAAKELGPSRHGGVRSYGGVFGIKHMPATSDNVRAEAQRLREISEVVRARAVSGNTYSAALWAAAHSHALQVKWWRFERLFRLLHRAVGYGVRPAPALGLYAIWTLVVAAGLTYGDSACDLAGEFRCVSADGYSFWDNLARAFLLPGAVLRSDLGGAQGYHPVADHPMAHFALVLVSGLIVGFVAVATRRYLLRPRTDS